MKHYVYKISNIIENKHYIGVRSSKNPIKDLGIKYFSSSSDKEFMLEQQEFPERFEYNILEVFSTRKDAINKEIELHDLYDVAVNESFYNKSKQTSIGFCTSGATHSQETKDKISATLTGKPHSEETKRKISDSNMGKKYTEETKRKMSKSHTGKILSDEHRKSISRSTSGEGNIMWGKKHTEETKRKISNTKTGTSPSNTTREKMSISKRKRDLLEADRFIIYDPNNKVVYDNIITNVSKFCAENSYPVTNFRKSFTNNTVVKGGRMKGWRVVKFKI